MMENLKLVRPDDVTTEEHLTIQLKRPITVDGTKYDFVKLRYPKQADVREMQRDKSATPFEQSETLLCKICVTPQLNKNSLAEISASDFAWIQNKLNESGYMGFISKDDEENSYTPSPDEVEEGEEISPNVFGIKIKLKRKISFNGVDFSEIKIRYPQVKDIRVMNSKKSHSLSEPERFNQLLLRICVNPPATPELLDELSQSDFVNIQFALNDAGFLGYIQKMT